MIELHNLKPAKGSRTKKFRIGRGNASGRGTTAGKGTKGQRARSGGRNKLKLKGIRQMFLSFPKSRGFKSQKEKPTTIVLERLAKAFPVQRVVDMAALRKAGLVRPSASCAKIVSGGEIKVALQLVNITATETAKAAIEKAGGSVKTVKSAKKNKK